MIGIVLSSLEYYLCGGRVDWMSHEGCSFDVINLDVFLHVTCIKLKKTQE